MAVIARRRTEPSDAVITTARHGRSTDLDAREWRYVATMGLRAACFLAMIFVGGPWRWVLLAGAAFLPGIAVLLANAIDKRGQLTPSYEHVEYHRALTAEAAPHAGGVVIDHDD